MERRQIEAGRRVRVSPSTVRDFAQRCVAVGVLIALSPTAGAQELTRAPCVQLITPTSVVLVWRTAGRTDSRVRFGSASGALTDVVDNATLTRFHEVEVSTLTPDTRWFYSVGTSEQILAGDDDAHFFFTAPPVGTEKPIRIWALGDAGTGVAAQRAVRDAYLNFTAGTRTDVWLMLGDNAYFFGTDDEYQTKLFEVYPDFLRQTALWPAIGNHDVTSSNPVDQTGPFFAAFALPKEGEAGGLASGTEAFYSFDYANVHFVCLDSTGLRADGEMMTWLAGDLAANTQRWLIAYWHHAPYSDCSHDSDFDFLMKPMREVALPILEDAGVDLVLGGHSHSYERSFLMHGHYTASKDLTAGMVLDGGDGSPAGDGVYRKTTTGPDAGKGAVYVVAGSGGGQLHFNPPLAHPIMHLSTVDRGSVVIDVSGSRLEATFLDSLGVLRDQFVIEKADEALPPREPTILFSRGDANVDGNRDIADPVFVLERLFDGEPAKTCDAAADAEVDGVLRITDAIRILNHLFAGAGPLDAPFPGCGRDRIENSLGCVEYASCD